MERYPLEVVARHLLVRFPDGLALIDTGSPVEIGRGAPFTLLGKEWCPAATHAAVLDLAGDAVGVRLDWLLGKTLLDRVRLTLDWPGGIASFAPASSPSSRAPVLSGSAERVPIDLSHGVPIVEAVVKSRETRMVLDSGAALSYAPTSVVAGLAAIGREPDFHPLVGRFETETWQLPVQVGRRTMDVKVGVLPASLHALTVLTDGWILGSDFFCDRTIVLDYAGGAVYDSAR